MRGTKVLQPVRASARDPQTSWYPHLVGVRPQRYTESAGKTEISQLEIAVLVDQQVLRLQITVQNAVSVAVAHTLAELHHELLDHVRVHAQLLACQSRALWQRLPASTLADWQRLHVLLQIQVEELEDEVELVAVGVHDVQKADDVGVVHLLEERDLADGGRGDALIFGFQTDLFERDDALVLCCEIAGLVDNSVGSWARLVSNSRLLQALLLLRTSLTLSHLLQLLVVLHGNGNAQRLSDGRRSCLCRGKSSNVDSCGAEAGNKERPRRGSGEGGRTCRLVSRSSRVCGCQQGGEFRCYAWERKGVNRLDLAREGGTSHERARNQTPTLSRHLFNVVHHERATTQTIAHSINT